LQRFQRGALSVTDFCNREGVSVASFYAWKRRLLANATPAATAPHFVPVRVVPPSTSAAVELVLPSGCVLRLSPDCDLAWLRQLLRVLGVEPC
jgi:hypothetical protein